MSKGSVTAVTSVRYERRKRARLAKLVYCDPTRQGLQRCRKGKTFHYVDRRGRVVSAKRLLRRIESLSVPPAWQDVWVAEVENAHIQAVGVDDAGRKQYLYHERWTIVSEAAKYDRMQLVAGLLPVIRRRIQADMQGRKLTKTRVLAAVVRLLDKGHLRVGNQCYAETAGTHGATTLKPEHAEVEGTKITLDFVGKSHQRHCVELRDAAVAKVIRQCGELDGQTLFRYIDERGEDAAISSTDVNQYLREISNEEITAKDFRTWWGSVIALSSLSFLEEGLSLTNRRKAIVHAVSKAAKALGNTRAVCRKSYIHPGILQLAEAGTLPAQLQKLRVSRSKALDLDERRLKALLPHLTDYFALR